MLPLSRYVLILQRRAFSFVAKRGQAREGASVPVQVNRKVKDLNHLRDFQVTTTSQATGCCLLSVSETETVGP